MSNYWLISRYYLTSELVIFNISYITGRHEWRCHSGRAWRSKDAHEHIWRRSSGLRERCRHALTAPSLLQFPAPFQQRSFSHSPMRWPMVCFHPKRQCPRELTKRFLLFFRNRPVHSLDSIIPLESTTPYNMTDVVLEVTFKSTSCFFVLTYQHCPFRSSTKEIFLKLCPILPRILSLGLPEWMAKRWVLLETIQNMQPDVWTSIPLWRELALFASVMLSTFQFLPS